MTREFKSAFRLVGFYSLSHYASTYKRTKLKEAGYQGNQFLSIRREKTNGCPFIWYVILICFWKYILRATCALGRVYIMVLPHLPLWQVHLAETRSLGHGIHYKGNTAQKQNIGKKKGEREKKRKAKLRRTAKNWTWTNGTQSIDIPEGDMGWSKVGKLNQFFLPIKAESKAKIWVIFQKCLYHH